jgi:hypothetical protein
MCTSCSPHSSSLLPERWPELVWRPDLSPPPYNTSVSATFPYPPPPYLPTPISRLRFFSLRVTLHTAIMFLTSSGIKTKQNMFIVFYPVKCKNVGIFSVCTKNILNGLYYDFELQVFPIKHLPQEHRLTP